MNPIHFNSKNIFRIHPQKLLPRQTVTSHNILFGANFFLNSSIPEIPRIAPLFTSIAAVFPLSRLIKSTSELPSLQ
jgi:hypothetical protein